MCGLGKLVLAVGVKVPQEDVSRMRASSFARGAEYHHIIITIMREARAGKAVQRGERGLSSKIVQQKAQAHLQKLFRTSQDQNGSVLFS